MFQAIVEPLRNHQSLRRIWKQRNRSYRILGSPVLQTLCQSLLTKLSWIFPCIISLRPAIGAEMPAFRDAGFRRSTLMSVRSNADASPRPSSGRVWLRLLVWRPLNVDERVFAFEIIELGACVSIHSAETAVDDVADCLDAQTFSKQNQAEGS
jgi:hypothetical protein